jgi:hypothetical protein
MRLFALFIVLLPAIAVAADLSKSQRAEIEARIQPFSHACVAGDESCAQWRCRVLGGSGAIGRGSLQRRVHGLSCYRCRGRSHVGRRWSLGA